MSQALRDKAAIVGIGTSRFGRHLPESQLALAAAAFKAALEDAGLERGDIDGLSIHIGWPLGVDYDQVAQAFGLEIGFVNQAWTHGRFVTGSLQTAAMAVATGMADVVACVNVLSFTRERDILGGPHDFEGYRETGGTHAETPHYGLTAPAGGAALAMQRYMALYGTTSAELAAVPVALRAHARLNPNAVMQKPMSVADHQASRMVVDPLRLFDCCIVSDGAAVVLVTAAERARDLRQRPVLIAGMQGMKAGRNEFIFAPPGSASISRAARARTARPRATLPSTARPISRAMRSRGFTHTTPSRRWCCSCWSASASARRGRLRPGCRMVASAPAARCRSTPPAACSPKPTSPAGTRSARWCASCGARPGRARSPRHALCNGRRPGAIPSSCETEGPDAADERRRETHATDQPGQRALLGERARGRAPPAPLWDCRAWHWPPGPVCPTCFSDRIGWEEAQGHGTVSTWTVVHKDWFPAFKADIPYTVAQIELAEGVRLTANIVECPADALRVGLPVEVVFDRVTEALTLPRFRPRQG